jgi:ubiquinone/menaquinone biosynthesis C-methylase UbiE
MDFNDKEIKKLVIQWYKETANYEWQRLQQDPYHQTEFLVTTHCLEKYLPNHGLVLDAGGGPGKYTITLTKKGFDVILLDLVPEMLEIAKIKIKEAGVETRIKKIIQGSIEDLSMFSDDTFDSVLCLGGPLNHLLNEQQREKSVEELIRVTKKGAPIFVSVISRLGLLRTILIEFPHEIKYTKHLWKVGDYIPGIYGEGFTAAHFFLPEELYALFDKKNVDILEMAGLEGLSSHHKDETNTLYKDQEKWEKWIEILLKTCTHPSVIGNSEHFLLVCRKNI